MSGGKVSTEEDPSTPHVIVPTDVMGDIGALLLERDLELGLVRTPLGTYAGQGPFVDFQGNVAQGVFELVFEGETARFGLNGVYIGDIEMGSEFPTDRHALWMMYRQTGIETSDFVIGQLATERQSLPTDLETLLAAELGRKAEGDDAVTARGVAVPAQLSPTAAPVPGGAPSGEPEPARMTNEEAMLELASALRQHLLEERYLVMSGGHRRVQLDPGIGEHVYAATEKLDYSIHAVVGEPKRENFSRAMLTLDLGKGGKVTATNALKFKHWREADPAPQKTSVKLSLEQLAVAFTGSAENVALVQRIHDETTLFEPTPEIKGWAGARVKIRQRNVLFEAIDLARRSYISGCTIESLLGIERRVDASAPALPAGGTAVPAQPAPAAAPVRAAPPSPPVPGSPPEPAPDVAPTFEATTGTPRDYLPATLPTEPVYDPKRRYRLGWIAYRLAQVGPSAASEVSTTTHTLMELFDGEGIEPVEKTGRARFYCAEQFPDDIFQGEWGRTAQDVLTNPWDVEQKPDEILMLVDVSVETGLKTGAIKRRLQGVPETEFVTHERTLKRLTRAKAREHIPEMKQHGWLQGEEPTRPILVPVTPAPPPERSTVPSLAPPGAVSSAEAAPVAEPEPVLPADDVGEARHPPPAESPPAAPFVGLPDIEPIAPLAPEPEPAGSPPSDPPVSVEATAPLWERDDELYLATRLRDRVVGRSARSEQQTTYYDRATGEVLVPGKGVYGPDVEIAKAEIIQIFRNVVDKELEGSYLAAYVPFADLERIPTIEIMLMTMWVEIAARYQLTPGAKLGEDGFAELFGVPDEEKPEAMGYCLSSGVIRREDYRMPEGAFSREHLEQSETFLRIGGWVTASLTEGADLEQIVKDARGDEADELPPPGKGPGQHPAKGVGDARPPPGSPPSDAAQRRRGRKAEVEPEKPLHPLYVTTFLDDGEARPHLLFLAEAFRKRVLAEGTSRQKYYDPATQEFSLASQRTYRFDEVFTVQNVKSRFGLQSADNIEDLMRRYELSSGRKDGMSMASAVAMVLWYETARHDVYYELTPEDLVALYACDMGNMATVIGSGIMIPKGSVKKDKGFSRDRVAQQNVFFASAYLAMHAATTGRTIDQVVAGEGIEVPGRDSGPGRGRGDKGNKGRGGGRRTSGPKPFADEPKEHVLTALKQRLIKEGHYRLSDHTVELDNTGQRHDHDVVFGYKQVARMLGKSNRATETYVVGFKFDKHNITATQVLAMVLWKQAVDEFRPRPYLLDAEYARVCGLSELDLGYLHTQEFFYGQDVPDMSKLPHQEARFVSLCAQALEDLVADAKPGKGKAGPADPPPPGQPGAEGAPDGDDAPPDYDVVEPVVDRDQQFAYLATNLQERLQGEPLLVGPQRYVIGKDGKHYSTSEKFDVASAAAAMRVSRGEFQRIISTYEVDITKGVKGTDMLMIGLWCEADKSSSKPISDVNHAKLYGGRVTREDIEHIYATSDLLAIEGSDADKKKRQWIVYASAFNEVVEATLRGKPVFKEPTPWLIPPPEPEGGEADPADPPPPGSPPVDELDDSHPPPSAGSPPAPGNARVAKGKPLVVERVTPESLEGIYVYTPQLPDAKNTPIDCLAEAYKHEFARRLTEALIAQGFFSATGIVLTHNGATITCTLDDVVDSDEFDLLGNFLGAKIKNKTTRAARIRKTTPDSLKLSHGRNRYNLSPFAAIALRDPFSGRANIPVREVCSGLYLDAYGKDKELVDYFGEVDLVQSIAGGGSQKFMSYADLNELYVGLTQHWALTMHDDAAPAGKLSPRLQLMRDICYLDEQGICEFLVRNMKVPGEKAYVSLGDFPIEQVVLGTVHKDNVEAMATTLLG